MSALHTAECRTILADGSIATLTATRRPREGRADVKCSAPRPDLAERMQQVVRLARHTEVRFDSRDQVMISIDRSPGPQERDWELAAVLADRMVRGLLPARALLANGWSDAWHLGRVGGHGLREAAADVLLGGPDGLPHLGALAGHPDPSARVSSARAWFPLHSGGANDSLGWVEVNLVPAEVAAEDEEAAIAVPTLDLSGQQAVRAVLLGARHFDGRVGRGWRTTVRFSPARFEGNSYELALVMADRIARGREFVPRGRILASGCSSSWHAGAVEAVQAVAEKCALLANEAAPGDRVLLPRACERRIPAGFGDRLRERGASFACVERIGII
ncbi:hypothetical protein NX773_15665 [Massilia solisilvae]|uniref:Uncharacterized protein n=1 Tax=Massilia solisilvae TaxID=1811225 RepID=A0ABT2BMB1_9BURK|nr:hypothetical protein [Massilia solisilvae]MCS0609605.1 hypothetical protein [Massilia solisilvae]